MGSIRSGYRQLDEADNSVLYGEQLSGQEYRAWLRSVGVRYVLRPLTKLDFAGATGEAGAPRLWPLGARSRPTHQPGRRLRASRCYADRRLVAGREAEDEEQKARRSGQAASENELEPFRARGDPRIHARNSTGDCVPRRSCYSE